MNDTFSFDATAHSSSTRSSPSLPLYAVPPVPDSVTRNQQSQQQSQHSDYQAGQNYYGGAGGFAESSNRLAPGAKYNQRHSVHIPVMGPGQDRQRPSADTTMFNDAASPASQTAFFSPMRRASNLDIGYAAPGSGAQPYASTDGTGRGYQNYQQPYSAGHSGGFGTSPTTSTGRLGVGSGGAGGLASSFASTLARSASLGGGRKKATDDVESGFMGLPTHTGSRIRDEEYGDEDGYLGGGGAPNASYGYYSSTPARQTMQGPPASASKPLPHFTGTQAVTPMDTDRQAPSKLSISMHPPPPVNRQGMQGTQGTQQHAGPDSAISTTSADVRSMESVPAPMNAASSTMTGQGQPSGQEYVRLSAGSATTSRSGSSMSVTGEPNTAMNTTDPWPQYAHRPSDTYEPAGSSGQSSTQWQQPRRISQNQQYTGSIPQVEISPEYTTSLPNSASISAQTSPYYSPRNPQRDQFSSSSPYTADPSPNRDAYGHSEMQPAGPFGNYLQPSSSATSSGPGSPMAYSPSTATNNLPYLPSTVHPAGHGGRQLLGSRSRSSQTVTQNPMVGMEDARSGQYSGYGETNRSSRDAQSGSSAALTVNTSGEDKWSRPGLKRVKDPARDLHPVLNNPPSGKRADPENSGEFLNPLKCLTSQLAQTYSICNPAFQYEAGHNPRRVLTKPSKPCHNNGSDNEDYDYILYVNDVLTSDNGAGDKYLILDVLGQGTFGQVVKCQNMRTHDIVAVKVVKNKPAYFNQSMMEVAILQLLNTEADKNDEHHLLRMLDSFIHHNHLCLVFECLSSNLYELIKHNQFRGLSLQLVKMFTAQLLDALSVLKDHRLIHCDLKPENILLKSLNSPQIKVIDFGSACHERQTVYTYIQSRFYRSPEVLLGLPYSAAIDMWSLGCIVAELFLGLPLFPGTSEYNQLSRIIEMLGMPPSHLLEMGKQVPEFFHVLGMDESGRKSYRLKPMEQYAAEHNTSEQPSKQYFKAATLPEIIRTYALPKKIVKQSEIDKEMALRASFIDFVTGLLNMDPIKRWSPQQAKMHPFITGEKFAGHWEPSTVAASGRSHTRQDESQQKKYGGLVSSTRNVRAYPDAAAYNQQLAQHQQYAAQAAQPQAQAQRTHAQGQSQGHTDTRHNAETAYSPARQMAPNYQTLGLASHARTQSHMPMSGQGRVHQAQPRIPSHGAMSSSMSAGPFSNIDPQLQPLPNPPNSYYPTTRNRANTINQMDAIPPALARLTHLGAPDPAGTRSTLTPVLRRDQDIAEWEQRHAGHAKRPSMAQSFGNPQLEYLQQQAEMVGHGRYGWDNTNPYNMSYSYGMQPPPPALENNTRVSQHRTALSQDFQMMTTPSASSMAPSSPGRYGMMNSASGSSSGNLSYLPAYPPAAASVMDTYDPRGDAQMAMMYTPMEPGQVKAHSRHPSQNANSHNPFAPQHFQQQQHHQDLTVGRAGGSVPASPGQPPQGDRRRSQQQGSAHYGYDAGQSR